MGENIKRTCLITGASAGIGAALAREYAKRGWDLALCARRDGPMIDLAEELNAQYGTVSHIFPIDLFKEASVPDLISRIKKKKIQIDGLVNNAGYGHPLMPDMVKRGFGRIMNIASLAGHLPGSNGHTLYAASKSYLVKFSESLNMELKDTGVFVSAICPGFTYTEFHDVNGTREAMNNLPDYMMMDADECARLSVAALENNKPVYITGRVNQFIALLGRFLPVSVTRSLMLRNSDKFRKT